MPGRRARSEVLVRRFFPTAFAISLSATALLACSDDTGSGTADAGTDADASDLAQDAADADAAPDAPEDTDASEDADAADALPDALPDATLDGDGGDAPDPGQALRLNEIVCSPLAGGVDWIEIINPNAEPVDVSGWTLTDDDPENVFELPAGTMVPADGYLLLEEDADGSFTFGLADDDAVFFYDPDDALVDAVDWDTGDAPEGRSFGRIPNGTGAFQTLNVPTPGAANQPNGAADCGNGVIDTGEMCDGDNFGPYTCLVFGLGEGDLTCAEECTALAFDACTPPAGDVVINEVRSQVDDAIELFNRGEAEADVAGWVIGDDDPEHRYTLAGGTTIEAGGYLVLVQGTHHDFGLGGDDAVILLDDGGATVDQVDWLDEAAVTSYCRRPNGSGPFESCAAATFGASNDE